MADILKDFPFRCILSLRPLIDYLDKTTAASSAVRPWQIEDLQEKLKQAPELLEPIEDLAILEHNNDLVRSLMSFVFAPVSWDTEAVAAVVPSLIFFLILRGRLIRGMAMVGIKG